MKVTVPIEVEVNCKQAIEILKKEAEQITGADFSDLLIEYEDCVYEKVENQIIGCTQEQRVQFDFSEDEDFVISIMKLVEAYKRFVGEDR